MEHAVNQVVGEQLQLGMDIVNDGEMSKTGYATYIQDRLSGFSGDSPPVHFDDLSGLPDYRQRMGQEAGTQKRVKRPKCTGPIRFTDASELDKDVERLRSALDSHGAMEGFMNAASPGVIAVFQINDFYPSDEDYLEALAEAMKQEYQIIADAGFILQIDCPDLAMGRHVVYSTESDETFIKHASAQVEALNYALENIPAESARMHVCWGNYEGPHHRDIELKKIFNVIMQAKPAGLLFEAANPRHAHEWSVFGNGTIPEDKVLIPGVIDSTSNYVEHPSLVAERICRFTDIVGRERVMAGADCGFATFAGLGKVDPTIARMKITSLVEGAEIASKKLWA
jgi:5-methyltetrahydropteroyltriglutamate--homocysteine methyltransferase